ncbi:transglycosylase SLT domain-containing protein [Hydromonas duriensis]|uniref:Transglycosylase-like protein with SLT domain n=1 Tax=Hydromonas duriensis TaxID=1527608 RepID=A0A4R6Y1A4_9BURK|nr:transglycosylase SLT domain-containing protein [Hydromonas duriensis]TDR30191.1 transglycosylase-like protein with SLT domain [Hydromonas duriensis]
MLKQLIFRLFNIVPLNPRTLTVCASALLIAACASNGDNYNADSHRINNHSSSDYGNISTSKDVWQRVRNNFGMPDLVNDEVARKEQYYATRADYVGRMAARSGDFLPLIMNEVEKRHMPSEIALLPFVESAFVTTASSPVKASGLWQFMPATGLDFSLQQNRFADQRNDVVASTDAALSFLQRLYNQFGDWHLALAAYNWGPGNVTKAVRRAQAAGYAGTYEDIRMPAETRQYVPKLQAIKNIVADPARFGISLPDVSNNLRHEPIVVGRDIDVSKAAELAGMDLDSFKRINPAFKKGVIAASLGSRILVPADRADVVRKAFADSSKPLATLTTYSTYSAESLSDIAARFNTIADNLRYLNNIPPYHNYVKANSTLLVPRTTNKPSQDIPYQALNSSLVTTAGGIGFGDDYAVESPVFVANADELTRQERSGIISPSTVFTDNTPSKSNIGLALSNKDDDLAQLIKSSNLTLNDPTPANGALIAGNSTSVPTTVEQPTMPPVVTPRIIEPTPAPVALATPVEATPPTQIATSQTSFNHVAPTVYVAKETASAQATPEPNQASLTAPTTESASPSIPALATNTLQPAPQNNTVAAIEPPSVAAESFNPALTPLDPAVFKIAEQENAADISTVAKEEHAVAKTKQTVALNAPKSNVKPVTAPEKALSQAKIVRVNYTPATPANKATATTAKAAPTANKAKTVETSKTNKPDTKASATTKKTAEAKTTTKPTQGADKSTANKKIVETPAAKDKNNKTLANASKQVNKDSEKVKGKDTPPKPTPSKNKPVETTPPKKPESKTTPQKKVEDKKTSAQKSTQKPTAKK